MQIFGPKMSNIPANDWHAIIQVPAADRKNTLHLLFFPTLRDVKSGNLSSKLLQLSHSHTTTLAEMELFQYAGKKFSTRRPGFHSILEDDEYCNVFRFLVNHPEINIPTWKSWLDLEKHVSKTTIQLLRHVLLWYDPS